MNLYGQRWYVETDLRSLKNTPHLEQLSCTTSDMVAKELDLGIAAYNLVRVVTCLAAAQSSGIPPRGYSFTRMRTVIETFAPLVATAKNKQEAQNYSGAAATAAGSGSLLSWRCGVCWNAVLFVRRFCGSQLLRSDDVLRWASKTA